MAKFKKGDRVVALEGDDDFFYAGSHGTVDEDNSLSPWVVWDESVGDKRWATDEDNLKLAAKTWSSLEVGDIVVWRGEECRVFGIAGDVIFVSDNNELDKLDRQPYTKQELQRNGWTIKRDSPADDTTELSVAELEEKLGIKSGTLRVKKG